MPPFYPLLDSVGGFFKSHFLIAWVFVGFFAFGVSGFMSALYGRLPVGRKFFLTAPSECLSCHTILRVWDVMPVLSHLSSKGKCRYCEAVLSRGHLVLEASSLVLVLLNYFFYGPTIHFVANTYLFLSLLLIAAIDIKYHVVPDEITLKGIAMGMLFAFLFPHLLNETTAQVGLVRAALGFLTGVFVAGSVRFLGDLFVRQEVIGLGDVILMGMVGCFLGAKLTIVAFFIAPFFALPFAFYFLAKRKNLPLSYAPFLALSTVLSLYFGDTILKLIQRMAA